MCGIAGVVTLGEGPPVDERLAERMIDIIAHRGPDDAGVYLSPDRRAALGRHLSGTLLEAGPEIDAGDDTDSEQQQDDAQIIHSKPPAPGAGARHCLVAHGPSPGCCWKLVAPP